MSGSFTASLPRKRTSAGLLLLDDAGRVLLVEPVYKGYWDLPGGHVEAGESPRSAARREAKEELGIDIDPGPLLVVDYFPARGAVTEALMFVFAAKLPAGADPETDIHLDPSELRSWRFCFEAEARALTEHAPILGRRIEVAWDAFWSAQTVYLESGYRVAGG